MIQTDVELGNQFIFMKLKAVSIQKSDQRPGQVAADDFAMLTNDVIREFPARHVSGFGGAGQLKHETRCK